MESDHPWCRVTAVDPDGTVTASWVLDGPGPPDLEMVDRLAHWALEASRRGQRTVLHDVAPEMADLVRLAALPVQVCAGNGT
jgi:hypothetical protein